MMRVLVTGVTGFIGSALCRGLAEEGHEIIGLSRNPQSARQRLGQLQQAFLWDARTSAPPAQALQAVQAVVNLAGESVIGRWTDSKRQAIYDSRVLGTRRLVESMAAAGSRPRILICASAIGYYGCCGDRVVTEDCPPGDDFLARVCRDWEREAAKAEALGLRVVLIRIGVVLGPGGGALQAMAPLFRLGLGGPLGNGRQWWAWVHLHDVTGLIAFALQNDSVTGPVNAVAPNPVQQKQLAKTLGAVLHRPALLPVPRFALKLTAGGFANELLASRRAVPKRAEGLGFQFRFPQLEAALKDILGRQ